MCLLQLFIMNISDLTHPKPNIYQNKWFTPPLNKSMPTTKQLKVSSIKDEVAERFRCSAFNSCSKVFALVFQ